MFPKQSEILLCTINASYIHASIGLRYLYANLAELQPRASILEFTSHLRPCDIVEKIIQSQAQIIGFGVYIWNTEHTLKVVQLLKQVKPDMVIIIGGPEVSYEFEQQALFHLSDYLIPGAADRGFAELCRQILHGSLKPKPLSVSDKVFRFQEPPLKELQLPYQYYTDDDIKNRVIYVEASRGCPFKCEFCLSALDKTAWPFNIDAFLNELSNLYNRGARNFKFVDRTFNLKTEVSLKILNFFLERLDEKLFLHFEIIPDRLPETLKETIVRFPRNSLQFEVGVQTFNTEVQALISRKQDNDKTIYNLSWLKEHSNAHIHADLIFGLPGEDVISFAAGFNQLYRLRPHDIQLGILKRLRGTPIIRHSQAYQLTFDQMAPYSILANDRIDFLLLQRISRFARYWELIANSGHFRKTLPLLLGDNAFQRFLHFSDWLYDYSGKTHQISLRQLFDYLYYGFVNCFVDQEQSIATDIRTRFIQALVDDYQCSALKGSPEFYKKLADKSK